jgi:predicted kinase
VCYDDKRPADSRPKLRQPRNTKSGKEKFPVEMILFAGIQASGKTTFYRERFFTTHVLISMDLLRTRAREQAFIDVCLATQQRFVVDNTNPTRDERRRYIDIAKGARFRLIGHFFEPNPAASFARNQTRTGAQHVPPSGLFGTLKKLERPAMDEGFDELYLIKTLDGRFDVERIG